MKDTLLNSIKSKKMWKDSAVWAFSILATIETIMSVAAISLETIEKWWGRLLVIILSYIFITIVVFLILCQRNKTSITLSIKGILVTITEGDIFNFSDWKLISFTERYDTQVDDIVINRNSVNGKFIEMCKQQNKFAALEKVILDDSDEAHTQYKCYEKNGQRLYPLGRIKIFEDYMLLSFTHFNEEYEAHLTRAQYEQCLRVMWKEISRTYANKPIALPLLGSGITRFDDWDEKSNYDLLKCMLCTLKTSRVHINKPITIILTSKDIKKINLYELKGVI